MSADYTSMKKYESPVKAFIDTSAPEITKTEYKNGEVRVYFNEPVNDATITYKVDNGATRTFAPADSVVDKTNYYLKFTPTADERKEGNHTVTLYNVADAQGNNAAVLSGSYSVVADNTPPAIESVYADGMYTFKIKLSEAVTPDLASANIQVKKGGLTLLTTVAKSSTDPTLYTVTVNNYDGNNPVYAASENSVNLSVNIKGYVDFAGNVGAEYNGSVTLTRDTTPPSVVNAAANRAIVDGGNGVLLIRFNENLSAVDSSKVTVKRNGIILTGLGTSTLFQDEDGRDRILRIPLNTPLEAGTYTVELGAGAVTDLANNKSNPITTTVTHSDSTMRIDASVTSGGKNVFDIAFTGGKNMTDSAIDLANYKLDGAPLPAGTTIGFIGDKQKVRITLPNGTVSNNTNGLLTISENVVNVDGVRVLQSVSPKVEKSLTVNLVDNVKPTLSEAKYLITSSSETSTDKIKLTFSENLAPVADDVNTQNDFEVRVNGVKVDVKAVEDRTAGDKEIVLTLANKVNTNLAATITIVPEKDQKDATAANNVIAITDIASNKAAEGSNVTTSGKEIDTSAIAADAAAVATAKANLNLTVDNPTSAVSTITLPSTLNGADITWEVTTGSGTISSGEYSTPARGATPQTEVLTATIRKGSASDQVTFNVVVGDNTETNPGTFDNATTVSKN